MLNPKNLPGQKTPSKAVTQNLVASMKQRETGIPKIATTTELFLNQGHINCPLSWNQVNIWPTVKNKIAIKRLLSFINYIFESVVFALH